MLPWELLIAYCACCSAVWVICSDKPHPQKERKWCVLLRISGKKSFIRLSHYFPPTQISSPHSPSSVSCICRVESERASLVPGAVVWKKKKKRKVEQFVSCSRPQKFVQSCSQKLRDVFCLRSNESESQGRREESGRSPLLSLQEDVSDPRSENRKGKEGFFILFTFFHLWLKKNELLVVGGAHSFFLNPRYNLDVKCCCATTQTLQTNTMKTAEVSSVQRPKENMQRCRRVTVQHPRFVQQTETKAHPLN